MRLTKQNALRKLLLCCCVLVVAVSEIACSAESMLVTDTSSIVISKGKYSDYYHINYTLIPDNTRLSLDDTRPNAFENESGQFEVYLDKNLFPIAAPMCRNTIILRMPGTNPFGNQVQQSISEKKALFERIQSMVNTHSGSVEVVIELNPYVKKIRNKPLTLELTQCNVFFRQAQNQYVNYPGKLKKSIIREK